MRGRAAILAALALCVGVPAEAQQVDSRTRGGTAIVVYVDGDSVGFHRDENKANQRCVNALLAGAVDCRHESTRIVDWYLLGGTPPPDSTPPDPDPTPDPDPDPNPDPGPVPGPDPDPAPSGILGTDLPLLHDDWTRRQLKVNQGDENPYFVAPGIVRSPWGGVPDGYSPNFWYFHLAEPDPSDPERTTFGQVDELYFAVDMRFSPDWDWGTGNGWTKWFTIIGSCGNAWWGTAGYGSHGRSDEQRSSSGDWQFMDQWCRSNVGIEHEPGPMVPHGEWFRIELYVSLVTNRVQSFQTYNGVTTELVNAVGTWDVRDVGEMKMGSTMGGAYGMPMMDERFWVEYANLEIRGCPLGAEPVRCGR